MRFASSVVVRLQQPRWSASGGMRVRCLRRPHFHANPGNPARVPRLVKRSYAALNPTKSPAITLAAATRLLRTRVCERYRFAGSLRCGHPQPPVRHQAAAPTSVGYSQIHRCRIPLVRLFACSLVRLFACSLVRLFACSLVRLFTGDASGFTLGHTYSVNGSWGTRSWLAAT